jgi:hypothetical protein
MKGPDQSSFFSFKLRFTANIRSLQDVFLCIKLRVCMLKVVHTCFFDCSVDFLAEIHAEGHFRRPELRPSDQVGLVVSPYCQEPFYHI